MWLCGVDVVMQQEQAGYKVRETLLLWPVRQEQKWL